LRFKGSRFVLGEELSIGQLFRALERGERGIGPDAL
jgi:hypothetical protein